MTATDETPIYTERKPLLILLAGAMPFAIGMVAAARYGQYWLVLIICVVAILGVTHAPMWITVTDTEVFVRSLTGTQQHALREMTGVAIEPAVVSVLRLDFRYERVKISGFTNTQIRNLHRVISTARDLALQRA